MPDGDDTLTVTLGEGVNIVSGDTVDPSVNVTDLMNNPDNTVTPPAITDNVVPTLPSVSITSDNANSNYAKVDDTITLTITSSENISSPTVTIAGNSASVSGSGTSWSATYAMQVTDTEGTVSFNIAFSDTTGNAGTAVTSTTDASSVTFDRTAPAVAVPSARRSRPR